MYTVVMTAYAEKNLSSLKKHGKETLRQLWQVLEDLENDPVGMTQALCGPLSAYRSLHVGRFRVIVQIVKKEVRVYVVAVGWHASGSRNDIYQRFQRAVQMGLIKLKS